MNVGLFFSTLATRAGIAFMRLLAHFPL
ncbi:MAG: hypothetical protein RLZZ296_2018, partial [Pseudomonadota bacterium]